jgi:serine/threonine protein kinase
MNTGYSDGQYLSPGTWIEEFVIENVLGCGGFGVTYLAHDSGLNRRVVIKENFPTDFALRDRSSGRVHPHHTTGEKADNFAWSIQNFLKEAETLASLDHPGIVRILRKFERNGTAYFVMPFVEGVSLEELITARFSKGRPFSEEELVGLLDRTLSALQYLHQRNILHRDLKPVNILITYEGIPILIDFGSARQSLGENSMTVLHSAGYTPFESLKTHGNVGPWSDLYSLAGSLVKATTGERPPLIHDRLQRDPYHPLASRSNLQSRFSKAFLESIDKAFAINEKDRWQSAEAWLNFLIAAHHQKSTTKSQNRNPQPSHSLFAEPFREPATRDFIPPQPIKPGDPQARPFGPGTATPEKSVFVRREGQQLGPFTIPEVNAHLRSGNLHLRDSAWQEGLQNWVPLSVIPGIVRPGNLNPAPIPLRCAAFFIDVLVQMVAAFILLFAAVAFFTSHEISQNQLGTAIEDALKLILIVVFWLYYALMESSEKRGTLGHLACGLAVTNLEGERITFGQATLRYFIDTILSPIFLCGYWTVIWTKKRQSVSDQLTKCIVQKKTKSV